MSDSCGEDPNMYPTGTIIAKLTTQLAAVTAELVQQKKDCTEHMIDHARAVTKLARAKAALAEDQVSPIWDRWLRDPDTPEFRDTTFPDIAAWLLADRRRAAEGEGA